VLSLTKNSGYLGAARRADALCETTSVGYFDGAGEFTLRLALNAVGLACV